MKIAMIDNYDSFTYNLIHYIEAMEYKIDVYKNDAIKLIDLQSYTHFLISPGFGSPKDSGICLDIIKYYSHQKKILGICLGHQCIAQVFDSTISPLSNPIHGKTSIITLKKSVLFKGLPVHLKVGRYHSLYVSSLGENLLPLAFSEDGILMALKHKVFDVYGVQFHPESILSEGGKTILQNFLSL
ncbi:aminodeoxychorismate/anthranilate synthase component II [Helicobacter sp. 13S00477-4]|uniref:anthranilate synthase component II n=1 Tax=Helicobacter sp. 13S00477-4 TaxID=1905759 RepID=UPI000BA4ED41|nr:aminodeoxychorismate/anthranilate synthase component II [Helicobacter sp. 13S00477-4]PAF52053.1 glutamine amidotransferase [Helicobacter sp. 13S00477-4]